MKAKMHWKLLSLLLVFTLLVSTLANPGIVRGQENSSIKVLENYQATVQQNGLVVNNGSSIDTNETFTTAVVFDLPQGEQQSILPFGNNLDSVSTVSLPVLAGDIQVGSVDFSKDASGKLQGTITITEASISENTYNFSVDLKYTGTEESFSVLNQSFNTVAEEVSEAPVITAISEDEPITLAADKTAALTDLSMKITQNGNVIGEGGTLDGLNPFSIELSFGVPVEGDEVDPPIVEKGDTASIPISNSIKVINSKKIDLYTSNEPKVLIGHGTFITDPVTKLTHLDIVFDGDDSVFDGTSNTVSCILRGDFQYSGTGIPDPKGDIAILILDKTFTIHIPPKVVKYSMTKTGVVNLQKRTITWTMNITTDQDPVSLEGFNFSDDLTNVGPYIENSFKINGAMETPATGGNQLNYTFPKNTITPTEITFETKIPDDKYYTQTAQTIKNKALLKNLEETTVAEKEGQVTFTPQWIQKSGVAGETTGSIYNPKDRTITWTVLVNTLNQPLKNVTVKDVLQGNQSFKSATLEKWDGTAWGTAATINPVNSEYALGNLDYQARLTITTSIPDEESTTAVTSYKNNASVWWDGKPTPGLSSGDITVNIGFNPITKSGTADLKAATIHWTSTVDIKSQNVNNIKVYDLLIYGKTVNVSSLQGLPAGVTTGDLTPQYNQRYVASTFVGTGLTANVYPVTVGGVQVGDLVEISGFTQNTKSTYKFDTLITDPAIFANNASTNMYNTVTLFGNNKKLNSATATVSYKSNLLSKEMLTRAGAENPAANVNSALTKDVTTGFNYSDKTVVFRLSVNANGLDLTNSLDVNGQKSGIVSVTDTLPTGWEFVDFAGGQKYLLFEGTGNANGTVTASPTTPVTLSDLTSSFVGEKATFNFSTLTKPYVILVKARPTTATADTYFDENKTTTVTNNVALLTEKWGVNPKSSQNVEIKSEVLGKTYNLIEAGQLRWVVDYRPYNLENLAATAIQDVLPQGIDLRVDAHGELIIPGNIRVQEMTLNSNGTYVENADVPLVLGDNLLYEAATRTLTFKIPTSSKGYRFSYITDVTGEPGKVSNKATLLGKDKTIEDATKEYTVTAADGSATLKRNGWMSIAKINEKRGPLPNSEFTLFAEDGQTIIRRGVTASDGSLKFKVIPDGNYIIRETQATRGYVLDSREHTLKVTTQADYSISVLIDGKATNNLQAQNFPEGTVGNLTIKKQVAGNSGETTRAFNFTVIFEGASGTYDYTGVGIAGGTIKSGDTISLAHDQSITIRGIPKDARYTIVEANYLRDGYISTRNGDIGAIAVDATQEATFTNTRNTGDLTLAKIVDGNSADIEKAFDFTVTFDGAPYTYSYTGNGVPDGTIESGDTISLAHNQSISIHGLPPGALYTIVEADYTADGYITTSEGATGEVVLAETQTATFTNTRNTGDLTLTKIVAGNSGDETKAFDFTVTFENAPYTYSYTGVGIPDGTIESGDTISLAHNQSIIIKELPPGALYTIVEADYTADGYITTSEGATGEVVLAETQTATFTNTRNTGDLTLTKIIDGNSGDETKAFDFTITFEGAPYTYSYTGNGVPDGTIESGDTISLAHNQSITIKELPEGATYTIEEDDYIADGYLTSSEGETGEILVAQTQTATFTNSRYTGDLTLTKTVGGNAGDLEKAFDFTITFEGAPYTYEYTGDGVPDGTIKSGDTISLAHDQSITIKELPRGTHYTIEEADYTEDGYVTSSEDATGEIIEATTQTASFTNNRYTGELTLTKTVTGNAADQKQAFTFIITLGAEGSFPYRGEGIEDGMIQSGDTISLAHGQSITIEDLPEGMEYSITELDYSQQGYVTLSENSTGEIIGEENIMVSFTNAKNIIPKPISRRIDIEIPKTPTAETNTSHILLPKTGASLISFLGIISIGLGSIVAFKKKK